MNSIIRPEASMARRREQQKAELKLYDKTFDKLYEGLESSLLSQARKITAQDRFAMGVQMMGALQAMGESANGTVADLGTYPKSVLELVAAFYGSTPLNEIASTQPISDKFGLVFFQQFISNVTRGTVSEGDILMNPLGAPTSYPNGFAGDAVLASNFVNDTVGGWTSSGGSPVSLAGSGQQFVNPIDPRSINLFGQMTVTVSSVDYVLTFGSQRNSNVGSKITVDPVAGTFTASALAGATRVYIFGTVNFDAGTITIGSSTASKSGTTTRFYADFDILSEGGSDVQSGKLILIDKLIQSQDFVLKSEYGLFEKFQYAQRFGKSIDDEIAKALMTLMNQELMYQVISILVANLPTQNTITWTRAANTGVSYAEHLMSFNAAIQDLNAALLTTSGRGINVTAALAGANACSVISTLPGFTAISNDNEFGPHIFGTLNGITIIRVPANSVLDTNTVVVVGRGTKDVDAPIVWSPWMPLMLTDALPMPNPIQRQIAALMSGGISSLVPALSGKLVINQTGFQYQ